VSTLLKIRQGQIYWFKGCEPLDGNEEKDRPVIVLSPNQLLKRPNSVLVVACTTHPRPRDIPRFEVPSRKILPATGLSKTCWAVPRWYLDVNPYRLTELRGVCPEPLFGQIFAATMKQMDEDQQKN